MLVVVPASVLERIRFAVREATAFVGHSFAKKDERLVEQITHFLTKLGLKCDSGKKPEPKGISAKIKARIQAAEVFVAIFTRHLRQEDGSFSTPPWIVDEKATAHAAGKRLLLFVENGVREFGGLQGDHEYIRFDRGKLGEALIHAMDYVLAITSVPLTRHMDHYHFGKVSATEQIDELKKFVKEHPTNVQARVALAKLIDNARGRSAGVAEFKKLAGEFSHASPVHHQLAHALEKAGQLPLALRSFRRALELSPGDYANNRCYGRCLHQHALTLSDLMTKRSSLEKARRLLSRAAVIGGQAKQGQIEGDLFVIDEALRELPGGDRQPRRSRRSA
jgi:tetratricopeptide (TPR) repeat protein